MDKIPDKSWTKKDFNIDWFSGTGSGGQHRNKHQNCVRITHIESNITTVGQNFRERKRNFDDAFKRLAELVVKWYYGEKVTIRFGSTDIIRSYNLAENRITDHKTNKKYSVNGFDLDDSIKNNIASM